MLTTIRYPLLGQESPNAATYGCPFDPPPVPGQPSAYPVTYNPDLNCMRDARGNTVCSDGMRYPPGCPKTPPEQYFSPGVTPDEINAQGMIEGKVPEPKVSYAASQAPASSGPSKPISPALLVGAGALGTAALATAAYFLFFKK